VTIRLAIGLLAILWNKDLEQSLYLQPFSRYWPHFLFPRSIVTKSISSHLQDNAHYTYRGSRLWPLSVTWRYRSHDHLIPR